MPVIGVVEEKPAVSLVAVEFARVRLSEPDAMLCAEALVPIAVRLAEVTPMTRAMPKIPALGIAIIRKI